MAQKFAIKKLERLPNGQMGTSFVDAKTGQPITDTTGYNIIKSSTFLDLEEMGLDPIRPKEGDDVGSETAKEVIDDVVVDDTTPAAAEANNFLTYNQGYDEPQESTFENPTPANNFGYVDKPGFMSAASHLPGGMGTVGKAVNAGINMNNAVASDRARDFIGLDRDDGSPFGFLGDMIQDREGYIDDVTYQDGMGRDRVTPVGFEAEDKYGRTTLTPTEARQRNLTSGLSLATKDQTKAAIQSAKANPDIKGNNWGLLSAVADFFTGSGRDLPDDYFPDAPAAPAQQPTQVEPAATQDPWSGLRDEGEGPSQEEQAASGGITGLF